MVHSTTYCVLGMCLACFDFRRLYWHAPNVGLLSQCRVAERATDPEQQSRLATRDTEEGRLNLH